MASRREYTPVDVSGSSESSELDEETSFEIPKIGKENFIIQVPRDQLRTSVLEAEHLLNEIRHQAELLVGLWPEQFEITRRLKSERRLLKQKIANIKMEIIEMKRKRWCEVCEKEATYLDKQRRYFYCSELCEQQNVALVQNPQLEEQTATM